MRAIQMRDYGGNDVLRLAEVPLPDPVGEIRIEVRAAGLNPLTMAPR
jgi:NADPH:quinone reductase-like Zn-dependent oxidoreductase